MLVVVSLELQVFHKISWIYQNFQDCLENSLNPKLIPKFPRSWENSQTVAARKCWSKARWIDIFTQAWKQTWPS